MWNAMYGLLGLIQILENFTYVLFEHVIRHCNQLFLLKNILKRFETVTVLKALSQSTQAV